MTNLISQLRDLRTNPDHEDGFTLIELMIVVVIIGILAAIAIPIFLNQQQAAHAATLKADTKNTANDVATALTKNPTAADVSALVAPTQSEGNTVTATGSWENYTVRAVNTDASPNCYEFKSTTGRITECVAVPGEGGEEAGEDSEAMVVFSGSTSAGPFMGSGPVFISSMPATTYDIYDDGTIQFASTGSIELERYSDGTKYTTPTGTLSFYLYIQGAPSVQEKILIELSIVNGHIVGTSGHATQTFIASAVEGPSGTHGPVETIGQYGFSGDGLEIPRPTPIF